MTSPILQASKERIIKSMVNTSSNLSTTIEKWEGFARENDFAHYVEIERDGNGLYVSALFNYFNGYRWNTLIMD